MNNVICSQSSLWEILRRLRLIYLAIERRDEFNQLIQWAKRKRLSGVYTAYIRKLGDEELRIQRATFRYPCLTRLASNLYFLKQSFNPNTRYYSGYAAKYKNAYLTGGIK